MQLPGSDATVGQQHSMDTSTSSTQEFKQNEGVLIRRGFFDSEGNYHHEQEAHHHQQSAPQMYPPQPVFPQSQSHHMHLMSHAQRRSEMHPRGMQSQSHAYFHYHEQPDVRDYGSGYYHHYDHDYNQNCSVLGGAETSSNVHHASFYVDDHGTTYYNAGQSAAGSSSNRREHFRDNAYHFEGISMDLNEPADQSSASGLPTSSTSLYRVGSRKTHVPSSSGGTELLTRSRAIIEPYDSITTLQPQQQAQLDKMSGDGFYDHVFHPSIYPYYQEMVHLLEQAGRSPNELPLLDFGPGSAWAEDVKAGIEPGKWMTRKQIGRDARAYLGQKKLLPKKLQVEFDLRSVLWDEDELRKGQGAAAEQQAARAFEAIDPLPQNQVSRSQLSRIKKRLFAQGKLSRAEEAAYMLHQAAFSSAENHPNELFWIPNIRKKEIKETSKVTSEACKLSKGMTVAQRQAHLLATYRIMGEKVPNEATLACQIRSMRHHWNRKRRSEARKVERQELPISRPRRSRKKKAVPSRSQQLPSTATEDGKQAEAEDAASENPQLSPDYSQPPDHYV